MSSSTMAPSGVTGLRAIHPVDGAAQPEILPGGTSPFQRASDVFARLAQHELSVRAIRERLVGAAAAGNRYSRLQPATSRNGAVGTLNDQVQEAEDRIARMDDDLRAIAGALA